MHYYEVFISAYQYRGASALTYSSEERFTLGEVVLVPMRNKNYPAIVVRQIPKPSFNTKHIIKKLYDRPLPDASMKLIDWLGHYYPGPVSVLASLVLPANTLVKTVGQATNMTQIGVEQKLELPDLTTEQRGILKDIEGSDSSSFLLHGDTGTGKTRVYIELINDCLSRKRSAIVLTPEISLTPQLAKNIKASVSAPVLILHSNLTTKERRELWEQILFADQPLVIIGARSALFAPLQSVGLIVIDEFHDGAYKQDQAPYYSSIRVAGALASIHGATLILGSATPSVTEYYIASAKGVPILRMREQAAPKKTKTTVEIVDARDRSNYAKSGHLSDQLLGAVSASLKASEQSLIFLNRRGTARIVLCQTCDWQATCPHCDLPLTYHGDTHTMRCHTCGYHSPAVITCPVCGSPEISYKSIGTKAITDQLQKLFPDARIKRFDTDNLKPDQFHHQYQNILDGKVDIIVGTQMLVKGLDLPNLSVVGVVAADSSLYFPDYTAEEQTYQLLSQVMGRVSRGHRDGTIVIQTNNPAGASQIAAVNKDWELFYSKQIDERRQYLFPPFCYLLKLTVTRKTQKSAISAANTLRTRLNSLPIQAQIIGPAPRFNEKAGGNYNWQITVKSKSRTDLLKIIPALPANWSYDIDPSNLL